MADRAVPYLEEHPQLADAGFTLAIVFACFTLASTSYLAWLYRLMECASGFSVEAVAMVGGYSFQAAGIGLTCALMRARPAFCGRLPFVCAIALHFACAAAAMLASGSAQLVATGFAMNFLYGAVCAFYLQQLARRVPRDRRGTAFGVGYACSVAATWAFSLIFGGNPLGPTESVIVCAVLSLAAIGIVASSRDDASGWNGMGPRNAGVHDDAGTSNAAQETLTAESVARNGQRGERASVIDRGDGSASAKSSPIGADLVALACITVALLSLVKNVGFGFPTADLMEGVSLESSRLFYAVGLLVAGIIADANRKYAALCCVAALVFPFGLLVLASEPIPETILWAADYLFFGFFSVYRVVLFCDIAEDSGQGHLAGFGLLFGRIGDAAGTALFLALADSTVALVAASTVLFAAAIFAFHHLFPLVHIDAPAPPKSPQDRFDEFAVAYGLSMRERDVLRLVLAGRTNAEVAAELFITEGTVKYHVHNLFKKTGCTNRRELLAKYPS